MPIQLIDLAMKRRGKAIGVRYVVSPRQAWQRMKRPAAATTEEPFRRARRRS